MSTISDSDVFYKKTFTGRVIPNEGQTDKPLLTRVTKIGYCIAIDAVFFCNKARDDTFDPVTKPSENWEVWEAVKDDKTCPDCISKDGTICHVDEDRLHHMYCRCRRKPLEATQAGTATKDGENGADWWLKHTGGLPEYYITIEEMKNDKKWQEGKSPSKYAQGKMIFGGVFDNDEKILPQKPGRIWYEADINYYIGRRNNHRVVWSNDGLIFVTYDHYRTFIEIV